jgi:hypothetical protein
MEEALRIIQEVLDWLESLGPAWNYFGHVDRAKQKLESAIKIIESNL